MGLFDNLFKSGSANDKIPKEMVKSFSADNGKNAVISIESEKQFPTPPFKGPIKKALRNNLSLYSKMFNGTLKVTDDYIEIDNSKALHTPEFDMGYEIELDYVLTITLKGGRWNLKYYVKETTGTLDFPFHGFMYYGVN
jgi:hypothetical protein